MDYLDHEDAGILGTLSAYRSLLELLEDRGYKRVRGGSSISTIKKNLPDTEKEFSEAYHWKDLHQVFEGPDLHLVQVIFIPSGKDSEGNENKNIATAAMTTYLRAINSEDVDRVIIVSPVPLNNSTAHSLGASKQVPPEEDEEEKPKKRSKAKISADKKPRKFEFFTFTRLLNQPTKHVFANPFRILSKEESDTLLARLMVKPEDLPFIEVTDPHVRHVRGKPGQIMQYIENYPSKKVYYRVIVANNFGVPIRKGEYYLLNP